MSGLTLAIETSQREGSVALGDRSGPVLEAPVLAGGSEGLMPAIDRLFRTAQRRPSDLETVAVSIGPGGFTGLRTAVATAKVLAELLGAQVVPVPTALVVAEGAVPLPPEVRRLLVVLCVKRRPAASAWCIELGRATPGDPWTAGAPGEVRPLDAIGVGAADAIAGEAALLPELRAEAARAGLPWHEAAPRATACLSMARLLGASAPRVDPLELSPLYARAPEAVALWQERYRNAPSG